MPERSYPQTYEAQLRRRILTPQPSPDLYPPIADVFENTPSDPQTVTPLGCVFAKSCNLPDGIINYANPSGFIPLDSLKDYGHFALLGGRETDSSGAVPLKKISGSALPLGLGGLALGGSSVSGVTATAGGTVAAGSASFATSGNTLSVTNTPGAIINWQQFSIQKDEITRFIQQNAASSVSKAFTSGPRMNWQ